MNEESQTNDMMVSLNSLNFLLGKWQAISKPEEPTGSFEFSLQLQSKIIVRTNFADYPATNERPAFRHEDLMIIYQDEDKALRADYYDSEGHIIRYIGQINGNNRVIFSSPPTTINPGFRLVYSLDQDGKLKGSFEIAQPNQPASFSPYLVWSAIKTSKNIT